MKDVLKKDKNIKPAAGATPPIIINNIDVRPVNRTSQDIPKWRNAIKSAEARAPRRLLLYDLYADVMLDGHVIAVTGKRFDAVTTANWQFVNKEGKPVDAVNEVIDTIGFDEIVTEVLNSKFWGYSILEPKFWKNSSGKWEVAANLLPRPNYRPHLGIVAYDWATDEGINIREGIYAKTVMEVGKPTDLGLLVSAAQYAILKRGGVGDYAMFVQVFGRPILDATWDGFDEAQRVKLQESLNIGPGGSIIRPEGTNLNILESKLTNSTIHKDFKKDMDDEISKALLGTTETTSSSNSSGYAQAKEHGEQDDNKHESDIHFVRKVLNSSFIKILEAYGFNTDGGSFIIQGEETQMTTKESFEMHSKMVKELGLPIDDDFFYETYGVPKPDNYDKIKAEQAKFEININGDQKPNTKDAKQKKKKEPTPQDVNLAWYEKLFKKLFRSAPAVTTGATTGHLHTVNLALPNTFNNDKLIQRAWDAKGYFMFDVELFQHTSNTLLTGFKKGWDDYFITLGFDLGFEYNFDDPSLLTAFEQNLFRFAGVKNLAMAQRLNELFRQSSSFQEFLELARQETKIFNVDWLETEYNTAVLTGESAATYHRLVAQAEIFPYWEYKTAGDSHVRKSHQLLAGIILPYNDERWKKIFPPNGWNCRCYVSPRLPHEFDKSKLGKNRARVDAYINSPEFQKLEAQGWGVNRAVVGEIFVANQQYIRKFPKMAAKRINALGAPEYGLQQYSQAKKTATVPAPKFEGNVTDWLNNLEVANDAQILRDYNNRPVEIDTKNFNRHLAKKDNRGILIAAMQEALLSPDEVWLNGSELQDLVYLKYYHDITLVSLANVRNGRLELSTWFTLREVQKILKKYRRGLLIFNNKNL